MQLRDWLRLARARLVADLHPDDIIDQLTGPGLISIAEESEIDRLDSREAKARRLIRLIALRDSDALLAAFHDSLKADYHWLTVPEPKQPMDGGLWTEGGVVVSQPIRDVGAGVDGVIVIPPLAVCSRPMGGGGDVESGAVHSQSMRERGIGAEVDGVTIIPPLAARSRPMGGVPGVEGRAVPSQPMRFIGAEVDGVAIIPPLAACARPMGGVPGVDSGAAHSRPMRGVGAGADCATVIPPLAACAQPMGSAPWVEEAEGESADFGSPEAPPPTHPAVTHAHLDQVASNAIALDSWRGIARDLGVTEDDIACVQARLPFDARGQCYEILRLWALEYEGATLTVLVAALRKARLNRLAARLMMATA